MRHASAEGAAGDLVQWASGAHTLVVVDDLVDALTGSRKHGSRDLEDVRREHLPGLLVLPLRLVPGAVGADHDPLHQRLSSKGNVSRRGEGWAGRFDGR